MLKALIVAVMTAICTLFLTQQIPGINDPAVQIGVGMLTVAVDFALCFIAFTIVDPPVDTPATLRMKSGLSTELIAHELRRR